MIQGKYRRKSEKLPVKVGRYLGHPYCTLFLFEVTGRKSVVGNSEFGFVGHTIDQLLLQLSASAPSIAETTMRISEGSSVR